MSGRAYSESCFSFPLFDVPPVSARFHDTNAIGCIRETLKRTASLIDTLTMAMPSSRLSGDVPDIDGVLECIALEIADAMNVLDAMEHVLTEPRPVSGKE